MIRIFGLILLLILPVSGYAFDVPQATENTTKIGLIDFQTVLVNSLAWQSFIQKIKIKTEKFQAKTLDLQKDITQREKQIWRQQNQLNRATLNAKNTELDKLKTRYQRQLQEDKDALDHVYANVQDLIRQHIYDILRIIADEKNINLVFNAGINTNAVIIADKNMDLTQETLLRLNKILPNIDDKFLKNFP